jgi:hypothetical protein
MRKIGSLALCAGFAMSGCSAAKSAMGILSPKPPNVTVVNNVSVPEQAAPAAEPAKKRRSFFEKVGIVTTTTIVGAGIGALAGESTQAAAIGAGLGAAAGTVLVTNE